MVVEVTTITTTITTTKYNNENNEVMMVVKTTRHEVEQETRFSPTGQHRDYNLTFPESPSSYRCVFFR